MLPSVYLIKPVDDQLFCTKEETIAYNIGCAEGSDGYTACIDSATIGTLYNGLSGSGSVFTKNLTFRIDGVDTQRVMTCTSAIPQTVNKTGIYSCTVSLPTGKELALKI